MAKNTVIVNPAGADVTFNSLVAKKRNATLLLCADSDVRGFLDAGCAALPIASKALLSDTQGSNKDLTFKARNPGTAGNSITVRYVVSGANTALSVSVSSSAITVNCATNGSSAATSTALQIKAALLANSSAKALVDVALKGAQTGAGVPAAFAATNLAGGSDAAYGYDRLRTVIASLVKLPSNQ